MDLNDVLQEAIKVGIGAREEATKRLLEEARQKGRTDEDQCG